MNNCHSFAQYLALILGQKQRQRPARYWPRPACKAPRTSPRIDHGAEAVRGLAFALFAADLVVLAAGMVYALIH